MWVLSVVWKWLSLSLSSHIAICRTNEIQLKYHCREGKKKRRSVKTVISVNFLFLRPINSFRFLSIPSARWENCLSPAKPQYSWRTSGNIKHEYLDMRIWGYRDMGTFFQGQRFSYFTCWNDLCRWDLTLVNCQLDDLRDWTLDFCVDQWSS